MNVSRRGLLGMFASGVAAAVITMPGLLMPVKRLSLNPFGASITLKEYADRILNPAMTDLAEETFGSLQFGDIVSLPAPGDTIKIGQSIWRVSWSTSAQFGFEP